MAFRENKDFGTTYFLSINSNGNLYERSTEPREGFSEHINPNTGQPAGYWKEYYNGIVGYIDYIGIGTVAKEGGGTINFFNISLKDYDLDENYRISIPMTTQKGGIKPYVKSFVKYFENIDFRREIYFNAFKRKKDDQYGSSELFLAYPGVDGEKDQLIERHFKKGLNGWPEGRRVKGFDGKETVDLREQDNFAYTKLLEYIEKFNSIIPDIRREIISKMNEKLAKEQEPQAPASYDNGSSKPATQVNQALYQQPQDAQRVDYNQPVQQPKASAKPQHQPQNPAYSGMSDSDLPF